MSTPGFKVKLDSSDCILRSGVTPYLNIDFINLIKGVNDVDAVGETLFPHAKSENDQRGISFTVMDESGHEILGRSVSLREKAIPQVCLRKLQAAIDQLHAWAEDPRVPKEKREFCRGFRLPDPRKDPDAYRLTGGMFSRKLHVLWGYEKAGSNAFLPLSERAGGWADAGQRRSIFQECRDSVWKRIFRLRNIVLAGLVSVAVYLGCFMPVKCSVHGCLVGNGAWRFLKVDEQCPKRCGLSGCGRHLDAEGKCGAHQCRKCRRQLPIGGKQDGLCSDCFWEK